MTPPAADFKPAAIQLNLPDRRRSRTKPMIPYRALTALLLLVPTFAPAQAAGPTPPPGVASGPSIEGVSEYRLANGLKVVLIPDRSIDTMTVNITYLVGSRQEGYGETGMAHLLEHLMFRGTKRFPEIKAGFQQRGV